MNTTILLVDDEERFLKTAKRILEKRGYTVETASNGLMALEKIEKHHIQLVILDVKMPVMDGLTTLKKIKRDFSDVETIMLTGHGTIEDAVEGVRLGAADYLTKPFDIDDITEKIEGTLAKRQSINAQTDRRIRRFKKLRSRLFFIISCITLFFYLMFFQIGYSWLNGNCQVLKENLELNIINAWLCEYHTLVTAALVILVILFPLVIWWVVNRLVSQVETIVQKRDELQFQLFHASKLASIGELASGIAHEINNPQAIIVARCGLIQDLLDTKYNDTLNPEKILAEVETIKQAAFRAQNITRQLIDFSSKGELRPSLCNINEVLDTVIHGLKAHSLKKDKINIICNFAHDLPLISLDINRIKQVIVNILNNAEEAISESGTITISTSKKDRYLDITITDTGSGMSPDRLKEIFKPFYTTKPVGMGTGLSLSVSLSIVESMGGTIDVLSTEGVGSSFVISLPR